MPRPTKATASTCSATADRQENSLTTIPPDDDPTPEAQRTASADEIFETTGLDQEVDSEAYASV